MGFVELLREFGDKYLLALFTTWRLTLICTLGSFILGTLVTVMRVSPVKPLRFTGDFFVQIFRNIPGSAMLILLVYALPYLNLVFSYYSCVVIAAIFIPSAFCSEYLMSGMNAIDKGQIEAAHSLGMNFSQIILLIVIPQAIRFSILPLTNLVVAIMLTTALASQVPMRPMELTGLVSYINTYAVGGITAFLISSILYVLSAVFIGQVGNLIDKKWRIRR